MYFSSLKDDELDYFHKTINASFTMSLTDILGSDLFKVDEVVEDVLYRIYPLFYCTNALSSNPKDKILDNKCFICTVGEHETYMSFTKGEWDNLIIDESSMTLYDIGDSLSSDEFNAMVYRLRSKEVLTGKLNFEESTTLTGLYGTYQLLHTENQPRNDYGYIINDNVKDNPLTVKLTNPFFDSANYKLTFTVKSITGANIFDETSEQYVDTDELTITLTEDEEVAIDLTEYTNDSVLLYDVNVEVDFKTAEKTNSDYTLNLTSNHDSITIGSTVTLTATLTSTEAGVTGYNVQFYDGTTLLDTVVTDNDGTASITITPTTVSTHLYKAIVVGLTSTTNVVVTKIDTTLTVTGADVYVGQNLNLNITLTPSLTTTVSVYDRDTSQGHIVNITNGTGSISINNKPAGSYTFEIAYLGDTTYKGATATKTITVNKYETRFNNVKVTANNLYGVLEYKNDNGNWVGFGNKQFWYRIPHGDGGSDGGSKVTSNDGTFNIDWSYYPITVDVIFYFDGDSTYAPCSKTVAVSRYETRITNVTRESTSYTGKLEYKTSSGNWVALSGKTITTVPWGYTATTNENGYFAVEHHDKTLRVLVFEGDDYLYHTAYVYV